MSLRLRKIFSTISSIKLSWEKMKRVKSIQVFSCVRFVDFNVIEKTWTKNFNGNFQTFLSLTLYHHHHHHYFEQWKFPNDSWNIDKSRYFISNLSPPLRQPQTAKSMTDCTISWEHKSFELFRELRDRFDSIDLIFLHYDTNVCSFSKL